MLEKGATKIYKPAIFVLFMVLARTQCHLENIPKLWSSCDRSNMNLEFTFEEPFKGLIYMDGYPFDPACSFRVPHLSSVQEVRLSIPFGSCGTEIDLVPNGRSIISNEIHIQQHNILSTTYDILKPIYCSILGFDTFYTPSETKSVVTSPQIIPELELKRGEEALGYELAKELDLKHELLLALSVPKKARYIDINVKVCVIHDKKVLDENSFFFDITDPLLCLNISSEFISAFSVVNNNETENLVAYTKMSPFKLWLTEGGAHITCGVQLCRKTCRRQRKGQTDTMTAITAMTSHKLQKRHISSNPGPPTEKQSEVRNLLLKSTIKALSQKLQREANRRNDREFEKRLLSIANDESKIPFESSGIPAYSFTNSDEVLGTISPRDSDVALFNANEIDHKEDLKEDDYEDLTTTTILPEITSIAARKGSDEWLRAFKSNLQMLTEKLEDLSKNQKRKGFIERDVSKKDKYETLEELAGSKTSTINLTNSNLKASDHELTLSILKKPNNMTQFEGTDFEAASDYIPLSTVIPSLPEEMAATDVITAVSLLKLELENSNSRNESVKGCSISLDMNRSTELANEAELNRSCVPQLTFLIVVIVLGFIVFTLIVVCCGMALYIRKEKKRHFLDNFLLYSYF